MTTVKNREENALVSISMCSWSIWLNPSGFSDVQIECHFYLIYFLFSFQISDRCMFSSFFDDFDLSLKSFPFSVIEPELACIRRPVLSFRPHDGADNSGAASREAGKMGSHKPIRAVLDIISVRRTADLVCPVYVTCDNLYIVLPRKTS